MIPPPVIARLAITTSRVLLMNESFLKPSGNPPRYVLMTAAHNEEDYLERVIEAVAAQTVTPTRWVIISDNSRDRTDEIISRYARALPFVVYRRLSRQDGRSFASKVYALRSACELFENVAFDYIGNLDADITLEANYFESLLLRCEEDSSLGIVSGGIWELKEGVFCARGLNSEQSVAHAAQLLRRDCYLDIGGYAILKHGGEDWHAQISAQMHGWNVCTFLDIPVYHHRLTGSADGRLRSYFRQGRMDHAFGSSPVFEFVKCLRRLSGRPPIVGGLLRLSGFCWSTLCRETRPVNQQFIRFLRSQQKAQLYGHLKRIGYRRKMLFRAKAGNHSDRIPDVPALDEHPARPHIRT